LKRALLAVLLLLAACAAPSAPVASLAGDVTPAPTPVTATSLLDAAGPERVVASLPMARPAQPVLAARFHAVLVADHCADRDLPAPPTTDAALTVLDRSYTLGAGYAPADLVAASAAGLIGSSGTKLVRSVIIDDLVAMREAWVAAGLTVIVESAYRSYASQAVTFNGWAARLGQAAALLRTARPGHSEHQLGTAIDVTSPGWTGRFGDWGRESAEGAWMAAHAWEYGFVMSYPSGSLAATCFGYEPWHYRWIGREAAAAHRTSGLYLRQFLERYVGG
jgi:D-alanyl-D-alanine carboxypeptidase